MVTPDASVMYSVAVVGTLTLFVDAAFGAGCVETTAVVTVAGGTTEVSVFVLIDVIVCGGAYTVTFRVPGEAMLDDCADEVTLR
jgi:actin-like ATPase involved in cell morphogenesis